MIESLCAFVVSQPIHKGGPIFGEFKERNRKRSIEREKERVPPLPGSSFEYSGSRKKWRLMAPVSTDTRQQTINNKIGSHL